MQNAPIDPARVEALGPAETVISTLGRFTDHLFHNRPGFVKPDASKAMGVAWTQATWRLQEDGTKKVFVLTKTLAPGKKKEKSVETEIGLLGPDGKVRSGNKILGEFRDPGIFPEVAAYLYRQIATVFKMDNELAAKWASWAFVQDRRDLKTVLAAFMLAQSRRGDPVRDGGETLFRDEDYRAVGEAMLLIQQKGADFNAKQVHQVGEVLRLPAIHAINRELGFSRSERNPQLNRYNRAVKAWLSYRELNPKLLQGLLKAGFRSTVQRLARSAHYRPVDERFYATLRWKQKQASDGRRVIGLDLKMAVAETWAELSEREICERILKEKPSWLNIAGRLPNGITRAIMASAVEAGAVSPAQLIMLTPTLEELGLLTVEPIASAWKKANDSATNQRAANVARNVKSQEVKEALQEAADKATAKALEKVTKDLRVYVIVDKSGSMENALASAKRCLAKFLGGFPLDRCHVSVFNSIGSEVILQSGRAAAVDAAFRGHAAGGSTSYGQGVLALQHRKPQDSEDVLFIFVGDEEGENGAALADAVRRSGLRPNAFASLYFGTARMGTAQEAARELKIPYFRIEESLFDDPYAVTQTLTNLIAATPVQAGGAIRPAAPPRVSLIEEILKTPLLSRPAWAETVRA